jgi:hypothetical protein
MQLPPLTTGVSFPSRRPRARISRMRSSMDEPPSFSPMPPAMMMTERAFSCSTSSSMAGAHWSAPKVRTNMSTAAGRSLMDGTHGQPSMRSIPGLTTKTRSAGNPFARTLRRMMRPRFIFSETPMMPIVPGRSRLRRASAGRAPGRLLAREKRQTPSRATSRPPRMTSGLTSISSMTNGDRSENGEKAAARSRKPRTAVTSVPGATRGLRPRNPAATLPKNASGSMSPAIPSSARRWADAMAAARPSRSRSFMYSTSSPPLPTVRTGPNSRVLRAPSRISEPKPTSSKSTFSATRKPRMDSRTARTVNPSPGACPDDLFTHSTVRRGTVRSMRPQAAFTEAASAPANSTPPASDLWTMSGETTLTTSPAAPLKGRSLRVARLPAGRKTWRGARMPAAARTL